jgi:putative SOS response-associated peptidase YedK
MCGRITLTITPEEIAELLGVQDLPRLEPRYNIAPTQTAAIIRCLPGKSGREVAQLRWGLVPHWATDLSVGSQMINARSESISQKPAFREALKNRRCIVLGDGFYEWQREKRKRQPFLIRMKDHKPFAFAGLWETWTPKNGAPPQPCETFTVLTTNSNELIRPLHDRMPVIIAPAHYDLWLDPNVTDSALLNPLFKPFPADEMECIPVNSFVNDAKNEGARCIAPPDVEKLEPTLFD